MPARRGEETEARRRGSRASVRRCRVLATVSLRPASDASLVILAANSPDWRLPLAALLRERGVEVTESDDVFDAITELRHGAASVVVLHVDLGEEEVALAARTIRKRHGVDVRVVLVGGGDEAATREFAELLGFHAWFADPHRYVAIANAVAVHALEGATAAGERAPTERPSARSSAPPVIATGDHTVAETGGHAFADRPVSEAELRRLLRVARHEDYFALLDLRRTATREQIDNAWRHLRHRLAESEIPAHLGEVMYRELREVRAAIDDAHAVLMSPAARDAYVRGLVRG